MSISGVSESVVNTNAKKIHCHAMLLDRVLWQNEDQMIRKLVRIMAKIK